MICTKLSKETIRFFHREAVKVRKELCAKYPESASDKEHSLAGHCIEASDLLSVRLSDLGFDSESVRCFCIYEDWEQCPEACYEEHWIVRVNGHENAEDIYIDLTMSQFQWGFFEELPDIYIGSAPSMYVFQEPDEKFLEDIGWTAYYNGADTEPDFDFYSHLSSDFNIEINDALSFIKER